MIGFEAILKAPFRVVLELLQLLATTVDLTADIPGRIRGIRVGDRRYRSFQSGRAFATRIRCFHGGTLAKRPKPNTGKRTYLAYG
jgi:hypothetical protein